MHERKLLVEPKLFAYTPKYGNKTPRALSIKKTLARANSLMILS